MDVPALSCGTPLRAFAHPSDATGTSHVCPEAETVSQVRPSSQDRKTRAEAAQNERQVLDMRETPRREGPVLQSVSQGVHEGAPKAMSLLRCFFRGLRLVNSPSRAQEAAARPEEAVARAFAAVRSLENEYPELRDDGWETPAQMEILEILRDHADNLSRDPVPVLRMAVQVYRTRLELRRRDRR